MMATYSSLKLNKLSPILIGGHVSIIYTKTKMLIHSTFVKV